MQIAEIWRYPVKSMRGEKLQQATIGPGGLRGDRRWAVVDAESGVSLSAKRYADLLRCAARTDGDEVLITMPGGKEHRAGTAEVAKELSSLLGRDVTTKSADSVKNIRHEFPTAITEGEGEPFLYETDTDGFVDCAPLQLLTTATLDELARLLPDSSIDVARFRPNFLLKTDSAGFVENDWTNKTLCIDSLQCHVYDDTRRCIMVALDQGSLPKDMNVIRTILKSNEGRAGIALRSQASGTIKKGATVEVLA